MKVCLLWIGAAVGLVSAEIGILACGAVLGAFAHTLEVGAVIFAGGTAVCLGGHSALAKRPPDTGSSEGQPSV